MPPRKSNSRKSDTSTARFVPMDDASLLGLDPASASTQADAPATTQAVASVSASAPGSAPAPAPAAAGNPTTGPEERSSPVQTSDKKDKEKEKESKEPKEHITIEDLTLPKSIITRLSKGVLPPNTQIQANAIMALSQSTTVFINYLASHANENTVNAGKKTISPADVFKALEETEFGFLKESLEAEFAKFNAIQTEKRTSYRQKVRAKKSDGADTDMPDTSHVETDMDGDTTLASAGPHAKRARVEPGNIEVEEDAVTEDEAEIPEDSDDDEADEEEEEEGEGEASGDDTHDTLEVKEGKDERDEALGGDESD
ncbi:dna polymerase epsilon subunit d [Fusarium heterosporum]|uniref:DNA polymerase epsilon subunit D n=1 Tax=Fusarium heterosporum TaxID=42747 RepID=A0A8H5TPI9_FUSHE|nr:dna polymerase epsilon subunit d [Fusarium heterosporum]